MKHFWFSLVKFQGHNMNMSAGEDQSMLKNIPRANKEISLHLIKIWCNLFDLRSQIISVLCNLVLTRLVVVFLLNIEMRAKAKLFNNQKNKPNVNLEWQSKPCRERLHTWGQQTIKWNWEIIAPIKFEPNLFSCAEAEESKLILLFFQKGYLWRQKRKRSRRVWCKFTTSSRENVKVFWKRSLSRWLRKYEQYKTEVSAILHSWSDLIITWHTHVWRYGLFMTWVVFLSL